MSDVPVHYLIKWMHRFVIFVTSELNLLYFELRT